MNDKNRDHYNKADLVFQRNLARQGGFDTNVDLKFIYPYIKNAKTILEVGAGFGRCIDFLLKKDFKGKIIAVERSFPFVSHIKATYGNMPNIEISDEDIKTFTPNTKVDTALWMWSIFIEFSKEQQFRSMKNIYKMLNENGNVIIDIPKLGIKTIGKHLDAKNLVWESPFGSLTCYIPDEDEMKEMAAKIGYKEIKSLYYKTSQDKERTVYVLVK